MDDMLTPLAWAARQRGEVGTLQREDGIMLVAYPLKDGMVLGMGMEPGSSALLRMMLRKRADDTARYGRWLPALYNDGGCYVLIRIDRLPDSGPVLDAALLQAGAELLR